MALANKIKSKLYQVDIPDLENVRMKSFPRVQEAHEHFRNSNSVSYRSAAVVPF